jgi:hypothetical protein
LGQTTAAGAEGVLSVEEAVTLAAARGASMGEYATSIGAKVYLALAPSEAILRQKYLHVINDSQFVLCPRGVGLNSIRFFETMRMGRIPILIANDTKLPLNWLIKYENLIVRVPEHDIINTSDYVKQWLQTNDLEAVSQQIRQISLTYFSDLEVFTQLVIHEYKTMLNMRKITNY